MTPELQSVLDRLEEVERHRRGQRNLSLFAVVVSLAAAAYTIGGQPAWVRSAPAPAATAQAPGVVEATRFLLPGPDGSVRRGMEGERAGTVKVAIGNQNGPSRAPGLPAQPTGRLQRQ